MDEQSRKVFLISSVDDALIKSTISSSNLLESNFLGAKTPRSSLSSIIVTEDKLDITDQYIKENVKLSNKKATEDSITRAAKGDLHPETSSAIRSPLGRLLPIYSRTLNVSGGRWTKVTRINPGAEILTIDGWEKIRRI